MAKAASSLILAMMFWLLMPIVALGADGGSINGELINGSSGSSKSVSGLSVSLEIYDGTNQIGEKNTVSDVNGTFSFGDLNTVSTYTYIIKVVFEGVDYYGEPVTFAADETIKSTQVTVFDTTTDDSSITIDMIHVILSVSDNSLNMKENFLFLNNSDMTYIGLPGTDSNGARETLKFTVPVEVNSISWMGGQTGVSTIVKNGIFTDATPVTPDGTFISYSYKLDLINSQKSLFWRVNYDAGRFDLLIENQNMTVLSERLNTETPLTINGKTYNHYSVLDLKKGELITAQISLVPTGSRQSGIGWIWFTLIPLTLIVIIFVFVKKIRTAKKGAVPEIGVENDADRLMQEIAALDDNYEEGIINKDEYLKLRSEKKKQLIDLFGDRNTRV